MATGKIYKLKSADGRGRPMRYYHSETITIKDEDGSLRQVRYELKPGDLIRLTKERFNMLSDRFDLAHGATDEDLNKSIQERVFGVEEEDDDITEAEGEDDSDSDFSFLDGLNQADAIEAVNQLPDKESVAAARDYEAGHKNRKKVVEAAEARLA